jgi:hypothetical protein
MAAKMGCRSRHAARRPDVKVKYAFVPKFYKYIFIENRVRCAFAGEPDGAFCKRI